VTAGNFLIAAGYGSATIATTIADSLGNAWTQFAVSGGQAGLVVYTAPVTNGGSDTVTATNTAGFAMALSVLEVTGQSASPLDPASVSAHSASPGTSVSSGATGTPASVNELAVGVISQLGTGLSARTFTPSLTSQSDETEQASTAGSTAISDGPIATAAPETFSATITIASWSCWCLLIQGVASTPTAPGFFASVGHPGPRVPANTFRQGGY
jgi:hypothetical protein